MDINVPFEQQYFKNFEKSGKLLAICANEDGYYAITENGFLLSCEKDPEFDFASCEITNATQLAAGLHHTAVLYRGKVAIFGSGREEMLSLQKKSRSLIQISCGSNHTAALSKSGRVFAVGDNSYGQCNVEKFRNISRIQCYRNSTLMIDRCGYVYIVGHISPLLCAELSVIGNVLSVFLGDRYGIVMQSKGAHMVGTRYPDIIGKVNLSRLDIKNVICDERVTIIQTDKCIKIYEGMICSTLKNSQKTRDICYRNGVLYYVDENGTIIKRRILPE